MIIILSIDIVGDEQKLAIAQSIANGHAFDEHLSEFNSIKTPDKFADHIYKTIQKEDTQRHYAMDGREFIYDKDSNTLVTINNDNLHNVFDPKKLTKSDLGTCYKPVDGERKLTEAIKKDNDEREKAPELAQLNAEHQQQAAELKEQLAQVQDPEERSRLAENLLTRQSRERREINPIHQEAEKKLRALDKARADTLVREGKRIDQALREEREQDQRPGWLARTEAKLRGRDLDAEREARDRARQQERQRELDRLTRFYEQKEAEIIEERSRRIAERRIVWKQEQPLRQRFTQAATRSRGRSMRPSHSS